MNNCSSHSVSVAGVVLDGRGFVLLVQRRDNAEWQIPGGVLELNESFTEGLVREVYEETGVWVEVEGLTGVYKNLKRGVVALVYRCRPLGGSPTPTDESAKVDWVSIGGAQRRLAPTFATRVSDAVEAPATLPSRVHDGAQFLDR